MWVSGPGLGEMPLLGEEPLCAGRFLKDLFTDFLREGDSRDLSFVGLFPR